MINEGLKSDNLRFDSLQKSQCVADLSEHKDIGGLARSHMKAASDLTQERLTVVEISGSDDSSYRHRRELEVTQSTRAGRRGLEDMRADRFGLNWDFRFTSPISTRLLDQTAVLGKVSAKFGRRCFVPSLLTKVFERFHKLEIKTCPFSNLPQRDKGRWGQGLNRRQDGRMPLT
jgi:hypothetical protein